jgi:hypothetical protein
VAEKNRRSTEEAGKGDGRANLRERIRNATREASLRKRRRPSAKSSLDPSLTSGGVRKWLCGPQDRKQSRWLGEVEAPDEAAAIEKGAAEFKVPPNRLMVIRRRPAGKAKSTAVISSQLDPKAAVVRWPAFQRVCFC